MTDLPNVDVTLFAKSDLAKLEPVERAAHPPRILLLYGSVRERSYSRFLTLEAARLLEAMGAETRIFDPSGLPLPDDVPIDHPKVQELRGLLSGPKGRFGAAPSGTVQCRVS